MFPLWDDVPAQRTPVVNGALIVICVMAFFWQIASGGADDARIREFGMIPLRVTHPETTTAVLEGRDATGQWVREEISLTGPVPGWFTLITCMFLHGGWMHLIGNLWFLYIFGDNVEDRYGHVQYLLMYLAAGVAAGLLHIVSAPNSPVPTVGASGAIGGVMGAYLFLYPHARVTTLIFLGIFTRIVMIPAVFLLGFWFLMQVLSGLSTHGESAGVAWWAHVGGFGTGLLTTVGLSAVGGLNPEIVPTGLSEYPRTRRESQSWD